MTASSRSKLENCRAIYRPERPRVGAFWGYTLEWTEVRAQLDQSFVQETKFVRDHLDPRDNGTA